MLRIEFEPLENGGGRRFERTVTGPGLAEPLVEEVETPAEVYPGKAAPLPDLHEKSAGELEDLGQQIAGLALGERGLEVPRDH